MSKTDATEGENCEFKAQQSHTALDRPLEEHVVLNIPTRDEDRAAVQSKR